MSPPDRWERFRPGPRRPPPPGGRVAPASARRGSRGFATTWWGRAWIDALEHRAHLDPNRLPRGRTYARQGYVLSVDLAPGRITAAVAGSRPTPYVVTIGVRTYDDEEWNGVCDAIAARAAHAAALLDGDLEPGVVDDARAAGVELLPDAGDLQPRCSCPDWADPCKHAAAVCYLVASELDEDPFRLLALRGRRRDQILAAVRRRRARTGDGPGGEDGPAGEDGAPVDSAARWEDDRGVEAAAAWHRPASERPPLPPLPPPVPRPGRPAPWPVDPPRGAPFDAESLRALAADAAHRAWRLVRGDGGAALDLGVTDDLARRAAGALGTDAWPALAARSGMPSGELTRLAVAWQRGGLDGVAAADEDAWAADPRALVAAREALVAAGAPVRSLRAGQNRVTVAAWRAQLRLGRDGRWWGFVKQGNRWELATAGHADVDDAADALAAAADD